MGVFDKINKQLGEKPRTQKSALNTDFIHPNSDTMVTSACNLIRKTKTGEMLLDFAKNAGISMHVLAQNNESGYTPNQKTVYISVPAAQEAGTAKIIILLAGALREAMQEEIDELKRPPLTWPEHDYAQRMVERNRDKWWYTCAVAHDLIHEHNMHELFDEFRMMGYDKALTGYGKDLEEAEDLSCRFM